MLTVQALGVALLLGAVGATAGQERPVLRIEACNVDLTEFGRRANFTLQIAYRLQSDERGHVAAISVAPENKEDRARFGAFVELDQLENCFRRWAMRPKTDYEVRFKAGTRGDTLCAWSLTVCPQDGECIEIRLPRCGAKP